MKKIYFLQSCLGGGGCVMSMHVLSDSKVFVLKEIGLKKHLVKEQNVHFSNIWTVFWLLCLWFQGNYIT